MTFGMPPIYTHADVAWFFSLRAACMRISAVSDSQEAAGCNADDPYCEMSVREGVGTTVITGLLSAGLVQSNNRMEPGRSGNYLL